MKCIRKITVFLIAAVLILSLSGCGGGQKAINECAGYYRATSVVENGEEADLKGFFEMGLGFFLVLNEDGSGYLDMLGDKSEFKWNKDELIVDNEGKEEKQPYSYDNGVIKMETAGTSMTFERMTDKETEDYKNGKYGRSPEEIGEELAQGILNGDEGSVEKAKSVLGEENVGEVTDSMTDALSQTDEDGGDEYTLPDLSDESHEDAGYYSIYAYTENGERYTAEDLAAAGVAFDLMLCPDGTGYANFLGVNYDLSWKDGYLHILKEDGVEIMDYGSGNYKGTKTISVTEEDDDTDVTMSFEYAHEADSTYEWKNSGTSSSKSSVASDSKDEEESKNTDSSEDKKETTASAPAEDFTFSFKGFKTTLPGDFASKFFGADSPDSSISVMNNNEFHFWLVDPETGDGVADGNVWTVTWDDKDLSAKAKEEADRIDSWEYAGEETIGSYKVYSEKKIKEKDSEVWRTIYFEADGNKFEISGTFKDLDTLGKFVDLYVENVKVEKE